MTESETQRRRPVRAIALLLLVQAIGLAAAGSYGLVGADWTEFRLGNDHVTGAERAVVHACVFAPPALLALLGALGSLFALRWGWLLAEMAQALCLGGCLVLYAEWTPDAIFPAMVYCVLMVLYLNSRDVRVLFHARGLPIGAARRAGLGGSR